MLRRLLFSPLCIVLTSHNHSINDTAQQLLVWSTFLVVSYPLHRDYRRGPSTAGKVQFRISYRRHSVSLISPHSSHRTLPILVDQFLVTIKRGLCFIEQASDDISHRLSPPILLAFANVEGRRSTVDEVVLEGVEACLSSTLDRLFPDQRRPLAHRTGS